jgi:hypothetical protein
VGQADWTLNSQEQAPLAIPDSGHTREFSSLAVELLAFGEQNAMGQSLLAHEQWVGTFTQTNPGTGPRSLRGSSRVLCGTTLRSYLRPTRSSDGH